MADSLLTFELSADGNELHIHGDRSGLQGLVNALKRVIETGEHEHLMTPSWGGTELSEERQGPDGHLLHHVHVHVW